MDTGISRLSNMAIQRVCYFHGYRDITVVKHGYKESMLLPWIQGYHGCQTRPYREYAVSMDTGITLL